MGSTNSAVGPAWAGEPDGAAHFGCRGGFGGCRRGQLPARTVRCGVVWEAGGRRPAWPAVPDSGIFSGDDALDKRHRNGREVRISGGAETRDGIVWAGSTHASRPQQHEPGQGPPRRACLAWVCRGGFWRAAGVLQARSSTQIIILRRAKGRSHVASEGAVALPPDRPFHIRILSKHHLF